MILYHFFITHLFKTLKIFSNKLFFISTVTLSNFHIIIPTITHEIINLIISFTLYPAHSRVRRGNVVLRHFVPHFPPSSGGIACWMAELNAALSLDTRAKKWKYKCKFEIMIYIFMKVKFQGTPVALSNNYIIVALQTCLTLE